MLKNAVGGISDITHIPGHVNVDFEDVKTVMSEPGKAMMGTATATGPDRATKAAEAAVACPLLEGIDLSGARGVLVLTAASKNTFRRAESRGCRNPAINAIRMGPGPCRLGWGGDAGGRSSCCARYLYAPQS